MNYSLKTRPLTSSIRLYVVFIYIRSITVYCMLNDTNYIRTLSILYRKFRFPKHHILNCVYPAITRIIPGHHIRVWRKCWNDVVASWITYPSLGRTINVHYNFVQQTHEQRVSHSARQRLRGKTIYRNSVLRWMIGESDYTHPLPTLLAEWHQMFKTSWVNACRLTLSMLDDKSNKHFWVAQCYIFMYIRVCWIWWSFHSGYFWYYLFNSLKEYLCEMTAGRNWTSGSIYSEREREFRGMVGQGLWASV